MIEASRNQLGNISNPHQGSSRKVLCVCSAGALRSPTLANVLNNVMGYNTRAVGTAESFAIIPITEALIYWADEIVFVDESCKVYMDKETEAEIKNSGVKVVTLDIPDFYDYGSPELKQICLEQYAASN